MGCAVEHVVFRLCGWLLSSDPARNVVLRAVVAVDDGAAVVADSGVGDSGVVLVEQALPYLRGRELGLGEEPGADQRPY
jgi:hypothetical protein